MTIKMKPTSYHVAKLAGVSRTTVSFVLNNRTDVTIPQKTRDAVLAAAKQLGYRPNSLAKALASGTTKTVSLWLTSLSSMVYLQWIQHMQRLVTANGYDLIFSEKEHYLEWTKEQTALTEWPMDGIFAYSLQWLPDYLELHPIHTPVVLMGHYYQHGYERFDHVGLDLYTPTVECMQYLISSGRKRIVYFQNKTGSDVAIPRYHAYRDAMQAAGMETDRILSPTASRESAFETLRAYLQENAPPDALVCCNDDFAIAALRAARDFGLRIPEDMAIAGSDGLSETAYHEPRMTTIELPYREICEFAWQFMEKRIEDPTSAPQEIIVPGRLIMRESTGTNSTVPD